MAPKPRRKPEDEGGDSLCKKLIGENPTNSQNQNSMSLTYNESHADVH